MNAVVVVSILIRCIATVFAVAVWRRHRDWRLGVVVALVAAMTTASIWEAAIASGAATGATLGAAFLDFVVSALALVGVFGVDRMWNDAEEAKGSLRQEHDLLHALMDNLPDSIYFKDAQSRFLMVSRGVAERFGISDPKGAIGKTDADFFSAEHAEQALSDERELMRSGAPLLCKQEQETWSDGRRAWVLTTKLPLRDADGKTVGTFGISRDITERKWAEEALRESEYRQRRILESALDAFVAMDVEGRIVEWNAQAEMTFGWSRSDILGKRVVDTIVPPSYREAHTKGFERFKATGEGPILNRRLEIVAMHRDGQIFPVEMTISAIRVHETLLFGAFVHDISDRLKAEGELRRAKETAEAANKAKGDFLANMSHEIRTPMNAIIGMTELVLDTPLSASQRDYLSMVRESGESLLLIINDILDFSKIEAGKLDLLPAVFSLRDSLGDTLKLLAMRAHRKGLELACHIDPVVPDFLIGDASRLRQIVVNLVGNAIKFTESGEVVLEVVPEATTDGETVLHFSVTDTGIGIPREKQSAIFAAFEQADASTTRRFGGTGLGLAISSKLVELMGGTIWVNSVEGTGSAFHFTARFGRFAGKPAEVPNTKSVSLENLPVLIVDDNATNRLILEEILRNWRMRPVAVAGAEEALELVKRRPQAGEPFRLILTDANMPQMDGFMFAEQLRRNPDFHTAVIMMLTSGDRPGDIAHCEQLGICTYLVKPIKQSELFDAIVAALGSAEPGQHATIPEAPVPRTPVRPLQILLAEDSLVNQKLAVGLLTKAGHTLTVANNGNEALAALETRPFDLVLMDVQMPEMDGLEAAKAIRERERGTGTRIPIIAMTAHAMKGDRELCLAAGMDGYVAKPVRAHELFAAIEKICGTIESSNNGMALDGALSLPNCP